jgi:hypothetical protein
VKNIATRTPALGLLALVAGLFLIASPPLSSRPPADPMRGPGPADFYVSPNGKASNNGSLSAPWDLATALYQSQGVKPGSMIWIRAGHYGNGSTIFRTRLLGTPDAPIVVRAYPHERATIDGWVQVGCCNGDPQPASGGYVWFWGLEFANSIKDRTGGAAGPPDWGKSAVPDAIDSWAPGTRFINLVIHDTREGIGWWTEAGAGEAYGNIVYYNGFQGPDRGHGHGIYVQNKSGTKVLEDNIVFDQFGLGIHGYGSATAWVRDIVLRGNIVFNNGTISRRGLHDDNILFGVGTGVDNLTLDQNFTYHTPADDQGHSSIGWQFSPLNDSANIVNNYWIGGDIALFLARWNKVTFNHNMVFSNSKILVNVEMLANQSFANYQWDHNRYFGSGIFSIGGRQMPWVLWRSSAKVDANSQFTPGRPTGIWAFVRPNKYEKGRANIVIYNWDRKSPVPVNAASVLTRGQRFEVRDVQNFFGPPVCTGLYQGGPLEIPMTGLAVAAPNGQVPTPPKHSAPEFGAFVLLPS